MKVVALISGGKDSVYCMMECGKYGHDIVCLANLHPTDEAVQELDSHCFQTVGHSVVPAFAECMEIPLIRRPISGTAVCQTLDYQHEVHDEVEDLYELLADVKSKHPEVEAVCSGAILSDYQRLRVENVCARLGLISLAYLWRRDQRVLYDEMITEGITAVIIKTACLGLIPTEHIGQDLQSMRSHLLKLADTIGCNPCGEGGEYETFVIDCPLFKRHIVLDECTIDGDLFDPVCPVGHLLVKSFHTEAKSADELDAIKAFRKKSCLPVKCAKPDQALQTQGDIQSVVWKQDLDAISEAFAHDLTRGDFSSVSISGRSVEDLFANLVLAQSQNTISIKDVFFVSVFLSDIAAFGELNDIFKKHFKLSNPPTRLCVATTLPEGVFGRMELSSFTGQRQVLHVQSISRWAPSCIGPYSQATRIGNLIYLAGSIGLNPEHMTLQFEDDMVKQTDLSVQHCEAILLTFFAKLSDVVRCTVFIVRNHSSEITAIEQLLRSKLPNATIVFIHVSSLPRNASVELALVANNTGSSVCQKQDIAVSAGTSLQVDSVASNGEDDDELSFASIICTMRNVAPAPVSVNMVISHTLKAVHNLIVQSNLQWKNLVQFEVYHSPSLSTCTISDAISHVAPSLQESIIPTVSDSFHSARYSPIVISAVFQQTGLKEKPSTINIQR